MLYEEVITPGSTGRASESLVILRFIAKALPHLYIRALKINGTNHHWYIRIYPSNGVLKEKKKKQLKMYAGA